MNIMQGYFVKIALSINYDLRDRSNNITCVCCSMHVISVANKSVTEKCVVMFNVVLGLLLRMLIFCLVRNVCCIFDIVTLSDIARFCYSCLTFTQCAQVFLAVHTYFCFFFKYGQEH